MPTPQERIEIYRQSVRDNPPVTLFNNGEVLWNHNPNSTVTLPMNNACFECLICIATCGAGVQVCTRSFSFSFSFLVMKNELFFDMSAHGVVNQVLRTVL